MYEEGENYGGGPQPKPSSNYSSSPGHDVISRRQLPPAAVARRPVPARKPSTEQTASPVNGQRIPSVDQRNSWESQNGSGAFADAPRERAPSDAATSPFPLNDIDYESSPAAVAQELSNLQALRRMSM